MDLERGIILSHNLGSENKDACEADLPLCFCICKKPVFSRRCSYVSTFLTGLKPKKYPGSAGHKPRLCKSDMELGCDGLVHSAHTDGTLMTYEPRHEKTGFLHNAKTKTQISFAVTAKLISAFVFAIRIVQSLYYLNPKFQASSHRCTAVLYRTWSETPKTGFLTTRLI